jgi:hypothetical protein
MAANPQIVVEYVAKLDKFNKAQSDVSGKSSRMGGAMRKGLVPAIAVFGALTAAVGTSVKAAQEAETAGKRLDAVFKAQGESTNAASDAAQAYAGELSKKIGVDDEVIMQGQAIIATFKRVSDETARTSGVFDRTTAAAADLAAAGFGSLEGNSAALAKALQDPAKGLSKLTRMGVSFTESEKKRITALQKSGKFTEAQKALLEAVEGQVKGTAEATATESEKMAVAYGEVQEELGTALLPTMQRLTEMAAKVATFFQKHPKILMAVVIVVGALALAVMAANAAMAIAAVVTAAWILPVLAVVAGIAALIAVGVLLWRNWDTIKAKAADVWEAIKKAASAVLDWLKSNWDVILAILLGPFGLAILAIRRKWDTIKDAVIAGKNAVVAVFRALKGAVGAIIDGIASVLGKLKAIFTKPIEWARAAADGVKNAFNGLIAFLRGLKTKVTNALSGVGNALKGPLNAIIGAWNSLRIPGFDLKISMPGPVPDIAFAWGGLDLPDIPKLAAGGIVTSPTLAMVGEAGPEAVIPLGSGGIEVRVFIGETELRGIVSSEVHAADSAMARMLMAGAH